MPTANANDTNTDADADGDGGEQQQHPTIREELDKKFGFEFGRDGWADYYVRATRQEHQHSHTWPWCRTKDATHAHIIAKALTESMRYSFEVVRFGQIVAIARLETPRSKKATVTYQRGGTGTEQGETSRG